MSVTHSVIDVLRGRTGEIGDIVRATGLGAYEKAFAKDNTTDYKSEHQRVLDVLYEALVDNYKDLLQESRSTYNNFEPNVEIAARELAKAFNYMAKPITSLPNNPAYNKRKLEKGGEIHLYPAHKIYTYDGWSILKDGDLVEFIATKVYFDKLSGHFVEKIIPAGRMKRKVIFEKAENYNILGNFKESISAKMNITDIKKMYGKVDSDGKNITTSREGWYTYRMNRIYPSNVPSTRFVKAEKAVDETPETEIVGGKETIKQ